MAAGTAVSYTISLTNKDNSSCSNTSFNLARTVPTGWTGTLSATSVTLAPGASSNATLNVTSASGSTAGGYGIGTGISSSVGSAHTASASATYTVKDVVAVPAPTPPPSTGGLTESVATDKSSYLLGQKVYISARVLSNGLPVSGAVVYVRVTRPNGSVNRLSATSGSDGFARVTHAVGTNNKEVGKYTLSAVATASSTSVTANAAFTVTK